MARKPKLRKLLLCIASFFACEFCFPSSRKEDRPFFVESHCVEPVPFEYWPIGNLLPL